MKTRSSAPSRLRRFIGRFVRGRRGAAAVEFALVSIPFFALMFGIIEVGLIYFVATTLEAATNEAAREIRTGSLQGQTVPETPTAFKTLVCNQVTWLTSCTSNLFVQVQTFSSFNTITQPSPVQSGTINQNNLTFSMGGPGDIVMVQTFYEWTVLAPALDRIGTPINGGKMLLSSTSVFRNEPYGS